MATQFVQNPAGILFPGVATPDGGITSLKVPRLTKLQAEKFCQVANSSLIIEHYTGPKKLTPPALKEVPRTATVQESIQERVSGAQRRDAAWLCQLHSNPLPLDWSAYNVVQDRHSDEGVSRMKIISVFGPLFDSPPAHPDTVRRTIAYLDTSLKQLGKSLQSYNI